MFFRILRIPAFMNHEQLFTSGRTSRRNMMRLDISVTDGAWWQRSGRGGVGGSSLLLYSRDKEFTTVTVYGWTQILLKVTSDSEGRRPAHLRDVQKRRVIYSHRYSLFMELTSMLTVFIISEAFLLSFILLFKERKTCFSSSIKQCTSLLSPPTQKSYIASWLPDRPELMITCSPSISRQYL